MITKNLHITGKDGFTIVELLVVIVIIGIVSGVAIQSFDQLRKRNINDCAQKLAADIRHARAVAMNGGSRAQVVITDDGTMKNFGSGQSSLWMSFTPATPVTAVTPSFVPGNKVLSTSSCASNITIEAGAAATLLPICPAGVAAASNRCMWFTSTGSLKESAVDKSIIITSASNNSYKARVYITSLTGFVRVQSCSVTATADCTLDSQWIDIL